MLLASGAYLMMRMMKTTSKTNSKTNQRKPSLYNIPGRSLSCS